MTYSTTPNAVISNIQTQCIPEITLKYKPSKTKPIQIKNSKGSASTLRNFFHTDTIEYREQCLMLLLNRANITIGWALISLGGTSTTVVDTKLIYTTALKAGAHAIIIAHNHPSGNTTPSATDDELTRRLKDAGDIIEIPLLDHIIITKNSHYSYADEHKL